MRNCYILHAAKGSFLVLTAWRNCI